MTDERPGGVLGHQEVAAEQTGAEVRRRRRSRRAIRPGTNPAADEGIDEAPEESVDGAPAASTAEPGNGAHDRWLREQRPPHWE